MNGSMIIPHYSCLSSRTIFCLLLAAPLLRAAPMDIYVSPAGVAANTGVSINSPVDLNTALLTTAIPPGSTVWLRGGTYAGHFTSYLSGTSAAPITVRSYSGERAVISDDRNWAGGGTLHIYGAWTIFRDFDVTNTGTDRLGPAPAPSRFRPMGIDVEGPNIKLINLVIHDTGHGLGLWSTALNTEAYGNLIFDCGSQTLRRSKISTDTACTSKTIPARS